MKIMLKKIIPLLKKKGKDNEEIPSDYEPNWADEF